MFSRTAIPVRSGSALLPEKLSRIQQHPQTSAGRVGELGLIISQDLDPRTRQPLAALARPSTYLASSLHASERAMRIAGVISHRRGENDGPTESRTTRP